MEEVNSNGNFYKDFAKVWQNHVSYNFIEGIDLTEKQIEIVNEEEEQMLIHGLAGTGKSITLLYKFVNTLIKEKEPKRVLLVTYNSNLITDIKKRLESCVEFNLNKIKHKVDIVTFHEAATEILLGNKIIQRGLEYTNADTLTKNRDLAFRRITSILHKYREDKNIEYQDLKEEERLSKNHGESFIVEEIFWMKANGLITEEQYLKTPRLGRDETIRLTLTQRNTVFKIFKEYETMPHLDLEDYALRIIDNIDVIKPSYKYDYIFADEYQDLDAMQIKALCMLTNKSIVMAGDQRQRIYNKSPLSYEEMGFKNIKTKGNKNLSKTFRSTLEIIKLANSLKINDADYREDEALYNNHGSKPVIFAGKHVPALKFVVKEIKSILLENPKASIAIIHREDVKDNVSYARSEQEKNLSAQLSTVFLRIGEYNKQQAYNENNILYTDPYNVKGMEFDVVFILDFCKVYYPNIKKINKINEVRSTMDHNRSDIEAIHNLEKKLLYVAMTRAKNKLYFVANLNDRAKPSVFLDEFDKGDYVGKGEYFKKVNN